MPRSSPCCWEPSPWRRSVSSTRWVARYLSLRYDQAHQEVVGAFFLDVGSRLIHEAEMFRSTLTRAAVEPRTILCEGLACNAFQMVPFYNHPLADPAPTPADIGFTQRMAEAGEAVGIRLKGHIILGENKQWLSLKETRNF